MLKHEQIWHAIDALAARHGLSASGLARRAGLDPTTFNRSKRLTPDGRQRWPSTESVAKILMATQESLDTFVSLISVQDPAAGLRMPVISLSEAASPAAFSELGEPAGGTWDEIALPGFQGRKSFAVEIDSPSASTLYGEGTVLVASCDAQVRRGDRVLLRLKDGGMVLGEVRRETTNGIDLARTEASGPSQFFPRDDIVFVARIFWASQ
ncbi:MAG TPA: helix-turn-helix transcriptional regulator [Beijerinckiaceae bacterium]|nr:helix-turn-helix transcriptional regulator [Beijerinckiaceae bacterium]